jgi:hypothetical protein
MSKSFPRLASKFGRLIGIKFQRESGAACKVQKTTSALSDNFNPGERCDLRFSKTEAPLLAMFM